MNNDTKTFYEILASRKSVREYADKDVDDATLSRLIEVLRLSQSAANRQPWRFIVVRKGDNSGLYSLFTKEGFKNAPVSIVACADPSKAWVRKQDSIEYSWVDVTIAVTEMISAATAEGLGTCWVAAIDPFETRRVLGIPENIDVVAVITLGYPKDDAKKPKDRKSLGEIISYGRWQ